MGALLVLGLVLAGATVRGDAQRAGGWEDVFTAPSMSATEVRVAGDRVWLVVRGQEEGVASALLTTAVEPIGWSVVGSVEHYAGLSVVNSVEHYAGMTFVGQHAWLAGGHAPVTITEYRTDGFPLRSLPEARYTETTGVVGRNAASVLKPHKYIEGMVANDRYLWAWYMGNMVMVTPLAGPVDWRPHRYVAQFRAVPPAANYVEFALGRGWAWHDWFVCLAAAQAPGPGAPDRPEWPVRVCALNARDPIHGRRLQPPAPLAGYTIRGADLSGDRLWVLGENQGRVKGFAGRRWNLQTISLPDFRWNEVPLPEEFQSWRPLLDAWQAEQQSYAVGDPPRRWRDTWIRMAVAGERVAVGTEVGPVEACDLVVLDLGASSLRHVPTDLQGPSFVNDLEIARETLWVADEHGLSRTAIVGGG
jgi:hypothetical protein